MANADTDLDLSLEQYLHYKRYGVLPENSRRLDTSDSDGRPRPRSASRYNRLKSAVALFFP